MVTLPLRLARHFILGRRKWKHRDVKLVSESHTESDGGSRMDPSTLRSFSGTLSVKPCRCLIIVGSKEPLKVSCTE